MPEVIALSSFEHGAARRRGDKFEVSENHAAALVRAGLVEVVSDTHPEPAAGEKSSASQAVQASPEQMSSPSARGGRRKKAAQ